MMGFCRQLRPLAWNYSHSLIACCMRGFLYTPGVHCHPIIRAVLCSAEARSGIGGFRLVLADSRSSSFSTEAPRSCSFNAGATQGLVLRTLLFSAYTLSFLHPLQPRIHRWHAGFQTVASVSFVLTMFHFFSPSSNFDVFFGKSLGHNKCILLICSDRNEWPKSGTLRNIQTTLF